MFLHNESCNCWVCNAHIIPIRQPTILIDLERFLSYTSSWLRIRTLQYHDASTYLSKSLNFLICAWLMNISRLMTTALPSVIHRAKIEIRAAPTTMIERYSRHGRNILKLYLPSGWKGHWNKCSLLPQFRSSNGARPRTYIFNRLAIEFRLEPLELHELAGAVVV